MNTYEIAELTAVLARHGLDGQCHIISEGHRTATTQDDHLIAKGIILIYNGNERIATISKHRNGNYRAFNQSYYGDISNTRAVALANLLDDNA